MGMVSVARDDHLLKRGNTYYYHRRVPAHLAEKVGRPVIKQSLKTSDRTQARKTRSILDVHWDAEFERLLAAANGNEGVSLPEDKSRNSCEAAVDRAKAFVARKTKTFSTTLLETPPDNQEVVNDAIYERENIIRQLNAVDDPEGIELLSRAVPNMTDLPPGIGAADQKIVEVVRRAFIELKRRELALLSQDFSAPKYDVLFRDEPAITATFAEVVREYIDFEAEKAGRNSRRPAWMEKVQSHVNVLIEYFGPETRIDRIDYTQIQRFVVALSAMPKNRTKIYGNMPLVDAIKRAKCENRSLLSAKSQRRYLDFLKNIMRLAANKRLIPNNPAEGIAPLVADNRSDADRRPPFRPQQVLDFFSSEFYQQWMPGGALKYIKKDRDWRFWLPLFAAFMGVFRRAKLTP
jgi:Domain of unknown function (DUF6538)